MPQHIDTTIKDPLLQNALIDYIVTTPNNFNANLFREFLANEQARTKLVLNYMKKITPAIPSDSSEVPGPSDDDDPTSHTLA